MSAGQLSLQTPCTVSRSGRRDRELSAGPHARMGRGAEAVVLTEGLFPIFSNKKVMCEMQSPGLAVFLHVSFALDLSREVIPGTWAELRGSRGCSSLLKVRLLSFMPLSAGLKH